MHELLHTLPRNILVIVFHDVTDDDVDEALQAFQLLARSEGILCALESAHAIAALGKLPAELRDDPERIIVVNLSGRGDKDLATILGALR